MKLFKRKFLLLTVIGILIISIVASGLLLFNFRGVSITQLNSIFDSKNIFDNNVEQLRASIKEVNYLMSFDEEIYEVIEYFNKIRVEEKPIYQTEGQFPDIPYKIELNGYSLGFSEDFSFFFAYKSISSTYPSKFKLVNKKTARKLFDFIADSESTRTNSALEITNVKTGSNLNDVSVSVESFKLEGFEPHVVFELKNNSDNQHGYGLKQNLYYQENGEWTLCRTFKHSDKRVWAVDSLLKILAAKETVTETYSFYLDDVAKEGTYRLETEALWLEFTLQKTDK